ncbi:hypothetical protein N0V88_003132 [Collariella sp. IMI 366227]|nr:hypothetical protein N0V88_003132 [Collariella sp. IMI 366227]
MAYDEDPSDLFAIPDFWRPSTWLDQVPDRKRPNPLFGLETRSPDDHSLGALQGPCKSGETRAFKTFEDEGDVFFKLPVLLRDLVDEEPSKPAKRPRVEEVVTSDATELEPELEPEPSVASDDGDFWFFCSNQPRNICEHKTWESFEQAGHNQSPPLFITEAGPAAFDALMASEQSPDNTPDILDAAVYCGCLLNLALGRSSVLFSWDSETTSFIKTSPHLRISGLSLPSIRAVDKLCVECGNSARHLQKFAETTFSTASTPTRVALAGIVEKLVTVVRTELNTQGSDAKSILQLQSVVQPAKSVLTYFKSLVKKLAQKRSDEGLLSSLFQEAQASEYRDELLREVTRELLRITSRPWTNFVEEWVGLKTEEGIPLAKTGPGRGFVKIADKMWIDDQGFELEEAEYFLDQDKVPSFVPEEMSQTIFETGRNLRFLREHHPEHPLSRPDIVSRARPPRLEWEFEWDAISRLEERVNQYRKAVSRAIQGILPESHTTLPPASGLKPATAELEYFGKDEAQVEANILASIRQLDRPLQNHVSQDKLTQLIQYRLYQPPNPSTFSNLSPLCIKLLFTAHHLRTHIDLLRQYFLLGNGLLVSRLSHALFDPNLSTAERRAGVTLGSGVMGLRLGGRRTWPPASSELRLALMGVLAECYTPSHPSQQPQDTNGIPTLPGDLSFSVRSLTPQEIDLCTNPDSLSALDFLRLSYTPPAALRAVFTPAVLLKYDRVFRLLLRVLRMLFVANELFVLLPTNTLTRGGGGEGEGRNKAATRLGIEARHFIRQTAAYFFDVGIARAWGRFEGWLDGVETTYTDSTTTRSDSGSKTEVCASPDLVRENQEKALDEVLGALFLRKRQAPVMGLLEDIYGVVLRKKVEVFVTGLEQLLVVLNMNGFYGKGRGGG